MAVSRLMDVNYTIGALQVAVGISGFLLGCSTTQTYAYYKNYPYDPRATKIYVAVLWLLETAQQVAAMHAVYAMSVTNWGHPSALLHPPTSISVTFHLGILIPPLLESFYLWRLHRLFGRALPCAAGAVFCWTRYAGWLLFVVQEMQLGYVSGALLARWSWLLITVLAMGAVLNAGIAAAMVCYLRGQRGTVGMGTKVLVDRLLMWTLQTGVITAVTYFITLIVFFTMRDTLVWMAILATTTKIFSNCLLSSLNARPPQLPRDELLVDAARFPPTQEPSQKSIVINISREYTISSTSPACSENGARADPEPCNLGW